MSAEATWREIARGRAPSGGALRLRQSGERFVIDVDGRELMSSWNFRSEQVLAEIGCAGLGTPSSQLDAEPGPRVLIGGLGMGFTLRAALDALPPTATVVVAEIAEPVVAWCRGPLAHLASEPLADPRVDLRIDDVGKVMRAATTRFDAILLDVDNGPQGLTRPSNHALYTLPGLTAALRTLRPGRALALWSAARHKDFERRMGQAGFDLTVHDLEGSKHLIYVGRAPRRPAIDLTGLR